MVEMRGREYKTEKRRRRKVGDLALVISKSQSPRTKPEDVFPLKTLFVFLPLSNQIQWAITRFAKTQVSNPVFTNLLVRHFWA